MIALAPNTKPMKLVLPSGDVPSLNFSTRLNKSFRKGDDRTKSENRPPKTSDCHGDLEPSPLYFRLRTMREKVGNAATKTPIEIVIQFLKSCLNLCLLSNVVINIKIEIRSVANVHQRGEKIPPIARIKNAVVFLIWPLFSLNTTPMNRTGK